MGKKQKEHQYTVCKQCSSWVYDSKLAQQNFHCKMCGAPLGLDLKKTGSEDKRNCRDESCKETLTNAGESNVAGHAELAGKFKKLVNKRINKLQQQQAVWRRIHEEKETLQQVKKELAQTEVDRQAVLDNCKDDACKEAELADKLQRLANKKINKLQQRQAVQSRIYQEKEMLHQVGRELAQNEVDKQAVLDNCKDDTCKEALNKSWREALSEANVCQLDCKAKLFTCNRDPTKAPLEQQSAGDKLCGVLHQVPATTEKLSTHCATINLTSVCEDNLVETKWKRRSGKNKVEAEPSGNAGEPDRVETHEINKKGAHRTINILTLLDFYIDVNPQLASAKFGDLDVAKELPEKEVRFVEKQERDFVTSLEETSKHVLIPAIQRLRAQREAVIAVRTRFEAQWRQARGAIDNTETAPCNDSNAVALEATQHRVQGMRTRTTAIPITHAFRDLARDPTCDPDTVRTFKEDFFTFLWGSFALLLLRQATCNQTGKATAIAKAAAADIYDGFHVALRASREKLLLRALLQAKRTRARETNATTKIALTDAPTAPALQPVPCTPVALAGVSVATAGCGAADSTKYETDGAVKLKDTSHSNAPIVHHNCAPFLLHPVARMAATVSHWHQGAIEAIMPVVDLRFTHDAVRPVFHAGTHCGRPLFDLVNALISDLPSTLGALPPLEVVWHDGAWRSLSNRRLWCLKAYMGICGWPHLNVRVRILQSLPQSFAHKNSSRDDGHTVIVLDTESLRTKCSDARRVCKHFFGSGCRKGDSCPFSHESENTPKTNVSDSGVPTSFSELPAAKGDLPPPLGAGSFADKSLVTLSQKGREVRPGDWNCTNPGCKNFEDNVVYASKKHCPLCHAPRPPSASDDGGMHLLATESSCAGVDLLDARERYDLPSFEDSHVNGNLVAVDLGDPHAVHSQYIGRHKSESRTLPDSALRDELGPCSQQITEPVPWKEVDSQHGPSSVGTVLALLAEADALANRVQHSLLNMQAFKEGTNGLKHKLREDVEDDVTAVVGGGARAIASEESSTKEEVPHCSAIGGAKPQSKLLGTSALGDARIEHKAILKEPKSPQCSCGTNDSRDDSCDNRTTGRTYTPCPAQPTPAHQLLKDATHLGVNLRMAHEKFEKQIKTSADQARELMEKLERNIEGFVSVAAEIDITVASTCGNRNPTTGSKGGKQAQLSVCLGNQHAIEHDAPASFAQLLKQLRQDHLREVAFLSSRLEETRSEIQHLRGMFRSEAPHDISTVLRQIIEDASPRTPSRMTQSNGDSPRSFDLRGSGGPDSSAGGEVEQSTSFSSSLIETEQSSTGMLFDIFDVKRDAGVQTSDRFHSDALVQTETDNSSGDDVSSNCKAAAATYLSRLPDIVEQSCQTDHSLTELSQMLDKLSTFSIGDDAAETFDIGCVVEVISPFHSWDQTQIKLKKGIKGRIVKIDKDGDANIKFPSLGYVLGTSTSSLDLPCCWVRKLDFKKLRLLKTS